jgi:hypothetical protein
VCGWRDPDDELPAVFLARRRLGQWFPAREKGDDPFLNDLIQFGKNSAIREPRPFKVNVFWANPIRRPDRIGLSWPIAPGQKAWAGN